MKAWLPNTAFAVRCKDGFVHLRHNPKPPRSIGKKEKSMAQDCGFQQGDDWFRYRAAAIIVENGCVLLVGNEREDYLYSVGGGVHMNETAEDAVRREVL